MTGRRTPKLGVAALFDARHAPAALVASCSVIGMSSGISLPAIPPQAGSASDNAKRQHLVRRARLLARLGLGWHLVEAAVAIGAGVVAGSVALVGFGGDSLIEAAAGLIVLWLMAGQRSALAHAERRAQQLIAASFVLLAVYVFAEGAHNLANGHHPGVSWIGIGLALVTLLTMPPLAAAKRKVGQALHSSATTSESRQTMLCAYLSAGLLSGLLANTLLDWWWADPVVAIGIGVVALREARDAWRGESGDCC
jgi:divalent metal cation (Fe/Co/Zn/Cd) transporter